MSYNLDALNEENGLADEEPVRSSKRGKNKEKPDNDLETISKSGGVTNLALIRHIVFFVLFAAASVVGFLFSEEVMANVGYGALPIGLWGVLFVYLALTHTRWLIGRYRETISSLIIALGGIAILGIFDAPLGSTTGATMGGRFGEILVREPYDWHRYDLVLWQQALAWVRAGSLFTIGAAFQFPTVFGMGLKVVLIGGLMAMSASVSLFMTAGGVASTIANKRHRDKSGVWSEDVKGDDGTSGTTSLSVKGPYDVTDPKRRESAPEIRGDVFDSSTEFVVDIGNTIIVEDDEQFDVGAQLESDEGWKSLIRDDASRASGSPVSAQNALPEFVAVGDHIGGRCS